MSKAPGVRTLQIFAPGKSVCYTRLETLARDKRSSLLRSFVNYGHKKFYVEGPRSPIADVWTNLKTNDISFHRNDDSTQFVTLLKQEKGRHYKTFYGRN